MNYERHVILSDDVPQPAATVIDRKAVHSALKAWHYPHKLGAHALACLHLVAAQHNAARHPDTPIGHGLALREVLRATIEMLKPDGDTPDLSDPAWRHYLLLERRYVLGRPVTEVAEGLGMAYSTFQHEQAPAMDLLAHALQVREQACGPVTTAEAGPAAPEVLAARPRHNLPAPLSSFIGREADIAKLVGWLTPAADDAAGAAGCAGTAGVPPAPAGGGLPAGAGKDARGPAGLPPAAASPVVGTHSPASGQRDNMARRLVTLTGVGGTGKSRLALEVARACLPGYANGAWLVELAPLADPKLLPDTAAAVFELPCDAERPALKALTDYLRAKTLLLVLDNCEHMLDACAALAEHLLCECPQLRILATSREALGLSGETALHVRSLAVPADESGTGGLAALSECEAVQLFVDRAGAVRPEFEVMEANASHVAQICRRLDGIPLAIELAAARVRALSVEQIAARLDDRFRLLTGGSRTALPRHQTLRAAMDWSYDLLAAPERALLAQLSVFAGGWTLEAAETVSGDPAGVLDGLSHLVDKSLVIAEEQDGEERYWMFETVRQYARDKLHDSGEAGAVRERHLDYYVQFMLAAAEEFHGPREFAALEQVDREVDNVRAALEWSLGTGRAGKGLRLAAPLTWFWSWRGYQREGRQWAERLLAAPEATARSLTRASVLITAGRLSYGETGRAYLAESVSIAREQGDAGRWLLALGLGHLGTRLIEGDPSQAEAMLAEGVALARSLGDAWLMAQLWRAQGNLFAERGDLSAARQAYEEGLTLCQAIGDQRGAAIMQGWLADVTFCQGDYAAAIHQAERCLRFFRAVNDRRQIADTLGATLCDLERASGRYDVAKTYCLEALEIWRDLGFPPTPVFLLNLGYIVLHEGDVDSAKKVFAESLAAARGLDFLVAGTTAAYGAVMAVEKKARQAVALLAFSHIKPRSRRTATPADDADYEHYLALARARLDEAEFQAAWAEGSAMTLEQALALVEQETAAPRES